MENILIGRLKEQEVLLKALHSRSPEMVAVIGRRRVGKTFLIRTVYAAQMAFEISGIQDATLKEQLKNFKYQLQNTFGAATPTEKPASWLDAFQQLITCLEPKLGQEKLVVFFDELPWLATRRSDFLKGLSFFWNSWASQKNIVVVICGSSASWMIQKVVEHKGGLHNRLTKRIHLFPFNLFETA
ncbi:MAG: ATP-binding protein [Bacteroidota bacterium]